jgi:hypothetical protein
MFNLEYEDERKSFLQVHPFPSIGTLFSIAVAFKLILQLIRREIRFPAARLFFPIAEQQEDVNGRRLSHLFQWTGASFLKVPAGLSASC